ncbi:Excinuclease ABC, C subunit-like [hydrothermal vent metagenome]|uniref:Excinuclease ABC, C subunit-like n=1 Tax=hydrothermal vent metagenome TaxID=652676 RepID=A0A3B1BEN1_9ZZZZ
MAYAAIMNRQGYTYILASKRKGTLYIGVTSDLAKRIWQHKNNAVDGFTKKYDVKFLVYYEVFDRTIDAIEREKQLKRWHRQWKINLIEENNPDGNDLYLTLNG